MLSYAGIGTRSLGSSERDQILSLSWSLSERGWVVYSGNAEGSDISFQEGSCGNCVIFLPWEGFNNERYDPRRSLDHFVVGEESRGIDSIRQFHPNPSAVIGSRGVRSLMSRNYFQVHGYGVYPAARFLLVCADPTSDGVKGGTGQAVRIARFLDLPVVNIRESGWEDLLIDILERTRDE